MLRKHDTASLMQNEIDENLSEDAILKAVRRLARQKPILDLADAADNSASPQDETERMVEALLFASTEPKTAQSIAAFLPMDADVGSALAKLKRRYIGRGVGLVEVAGGWRFQTAPDLAHLFDEQREEPKKLSRAALETLAIIAYHQPCTRAEIEDIRGVSVGRGTLDLIMELKWVRTGARRRSPGKPLTYRTTDAFLAHFNLATLDDLPGKADLQAQGLLSANLPREFEVPSPNTTLNNMERDDYEENGDESHDFANDFFE